MSRIYDFTLRTDGADSCIFYHSIQCSVGHMLDDLSQCLQIIFSTCFVEGMVSCMVTSPQPTTYSYRQFENDTAQGSNKDTRDSKLILIVCTLDTR